MKSMRIILIVVALLALAGVILLTKVPIFNWDDSTIFLPEDDEPFGCKFFDEMAEATLPNGYSYFDGNPREMLEGKTPCRCFSCLNTCMLKLRWKSCSPLL